ncbi:hypothetical protein FACS189481_6290 [Clostridia bacterium]|nr:hypothetical protein FACS189481_6290 [Clostridia bacterium]
MFMRKVQAGDLRRGQTVQRGMRTDKVEEKYEGCDEVVGRRKRRKALFGLVPSFELFVETLNEVVGNVVLETLNANVPNVRQQGFDGNRVG